jgi:group I intron endonuclease
MTNLRAKSIKICVYKITNPKKRIYIGSTIDFKARIASYKRLDCEKQPRLYNSFIKYGIERHKFEIICECTLSNVRQMEAYYGHLYSCLGRQGLNCLLPKHGESFKCRSDETNKKMGLTKIGNTNVLGRKATIAQRNYLSQIRKGKRHKPHSLSTKEKMSKSATGGKNHKAITLLNTQTFIYYECFQDAAFSMGLNYNTFRSRLYHSYRNMPFIKC